MIIKSRDEWNISLTHDDVIDVTEKAQGTKIIVIYAQTFKSIDIFKIGVIPALVLCGIDHSFVCQKFRNLCISF